MNQPALYSRANKLQRHNAKLIIEEFADIIQLRPDGRDSLIDVGCGPGDVLVDFIVPTLPKPFSNVVGVDISPQMIEYAKRMHGGHDRMDFKELDIETDRMPLEYCEQFDHVTSFYCLHWTKDQRQPLKNIYNMLRKNGDCLLVYPSSCSIFDMYAIVAKHPKWSEYMTTTSSVPPTQLSPDPGLVYRNLLKEAGFSYFTVEIRSTPHTFEGQKVFSDFLMAVSPFVDRIPQQLRREFFDEMCKCWHQMGLCEKMEDKDDYIYVMPNSTVVAYARR